ncbi:MAG: hypothetical protein ACI8P0_003828 [Planctomycetaceae bacterium]
MLNSRVEIFDELFGCVFLGRVALLLTIASWLLATFWSFTFSAGATSCLRQALLLFFGKNILESGQNFAVQFLT